MSMVQILMEQLQGGTTREIGARLGIDERQASTAIAGALPMLLGGLARNTQQRGGADALLGALDRDHDGSVLDDLAGYLQAGPGRHGDGILGHVFGGQRATVEAGLGQMAGLDSAKAGQLMAMLAPLVMGALGREKRRANLDTGGLESMLRREQSQAPTEARQTMGMVGKLLDRDGDGSVADDLASMGTGLLGKMLRRRR